MAFTLLEVLIALAIFLMLIVGIYASWTQIHRATRVGLEAAAENQRKRVAMRALEQSLGSVKYFLANETNYTFIAEFDGNSYLSFVSHLPDTFPRSAIFQHQPIRRVQFSVKEGTNGLALNLRQQPILYEANIDDDENPLKLADSLTSFYVEYLPDGDPEEVEWQDYWDLTNDLPVMARVTLTFGYEHRGEESHTKMISLASSPVPPEFQMGRPEPGGGRDPASGRTVDGAVATGAAATGAAIVRAIRGANRAAVAPVEVVRVGAARVVSRVEVVAAVAVVVGGGRGG